MYCLGDMSSCRYLLPRLPFTGLSRNSGLERDLGIVDLVDNNEADRVSFFLVADLLRELLNASPDWVDTAKVLKNPWRSWMDRILDTVRSGQPDICGNTGASPSN